MSLLFRLVYVLKFNFKFYRFKTSKKIENFNEGVSIIIAAKNEANNLAENLKTILTQNYNNYEVVIVDDYSTDNTLQVLKTFQKKFEHLKIVEKENFENVAGKKSALTTAIGFAKNKILLFTDADCKPNSKNWLFTMAKHFINPKTEIVLGYAPYTKKNNFLNNFIEFETLKTALTYFGFALNNLTFMGVGRNLAYRKSCFIKINGFKNNSKIASGDDDLTITNIAKKGNTVIDFSENAWCYSKAENTFKNYLKQKKRHVSTAKFYKTKVKAWLFFYAFFHITFYLALIIGLFYNPFLLLLFLVLNLIIIHFEYFNATKIFKLPHIKFKIYILDFLFLVYYFTNFSSAFLEKKYKNW